MEYAALFIWLSLCLVMGGLIHSVMAGALSHRPVMLLAAPGMVVRKFSMTLAALICGGTVTRVRIYELSSRDIDFRADGTTSVAKVLVPLAPLFAGAAAMAVLNGMFGSPLSLSHEPPVLASLDSGGVRGFILGTWGLLSDVVRQGLASDWGNPRLYVLFALVFSLALGACEPMERVRQAILGAALLALALALLSTIAVRRVGVLAATPAWLQATQAFVVRSSAVAFGMMVYGMFAALIVGFSVRIYELLSGSKKSPKAPKSRGRTASLEDEDIRQAA
jgi:hypothetical protein